MAANIGSTRVLSGAALLGVGLASLLFAYFFVAGPEHSDSSPPPAPALQPQAPSAAPADGRKPETSAEADAAVVAAAPTERIAAETSAQPDARLQDAELQHLREVFQNSVVPSFQYDFQLHREGRAAIDAFVASMPENLSSEDLDTLSTMIENQLATSEAEDLAFIITHLYRLEQEEARLMKEIEPVTTMAGQQEAQEQLAQLRDEWFGPELSARLFSEADNDQPGANAGSDQSTAEGTAKGDSSGEPTEPRSEAQTELADIESGWEQRYQTFLADKRFIDNAGLDQAEKDRQIEALLRQHYPPEELEAARAFDQQQR
ncbi:MAG: hypothetical protein ACQEV6_10745 [Pseudomonadota bacterium]